jgi:hypothetical protein
MWEVPRFRVRAYVRALGQRRLERSVQAELKSTVHFKRTQAQIITQAGFGVAATIVPARVVLNDLQPSEITLFSAQAFTVGDSVAFMLEQPHPFYVKGKIAYCRTFEVGPRIKAAQHFPFRVKIVFEFLSQDEAEAVREYCRELARSVLGVA